VANGSTSEDASAGSGGLQRHLRNRLALECPDMIPSVLERLAAGFAIHPHDGAAKLEEILDRAKRKGVTNISGYVKRAGEAELARPSAPRYPGREALVAAGITPELTPTTTYGDALNAGGRDIQEELDRREREAALLFARLTGQEVAA
jgi:hypothetical protein